MAYSLDIYWGILVQMLDPILIGVAIMLYRFSNNAQTTTRFLIAFVVACVMAFLSGWLASYASGVEGAIKISSALVSFLAFMLLFTIVYGIGSLIKTLKK